MTRPTFFFALLLCVSASRPLVAAETYTAGLPTNKTFAAFAQPFLKINCLDCHDNETKKGDFSLENLGPVNESNAAQWKTIWAQVALREMPPKKTKTQPAVAERLLFTDWVVEELTKALKDKGGFQAHLDPQKANYLDHDLLFGPLPQNVNLIPTSTPARLWRLTRDEQLVRINELVNIEADYDPKKPGLRTRGDAIPVDIDGAVKVYFGLDSLILPKVEGGGAQRIKLIKSVVSPFSSFRNTGLTNYPIYYSVNSAQSLQIYDLAQDVIRFMAYGPAGFSSNIHDAGESQTKKKGEKSEKGNDNMPKGPSRLPTAEFSSKIARPITPVYDLMKSQGLSDGTLTEAVNYLFEAATFRPPTTEETVQYREIVKKSIEKVGKEAGVQLGLAAIFVNRDALFHPELAHGNKPDAYGRVMLQDWELGLAVNHAFCYIKPDKKLKDAIESGRMRTKADVQREVERIFNDDTIRKPRILRFFRDYFDYDRSGYLCKDAKSIAETGVTKEEAVNDHYRAMHDSTINTERLIELILHEDKDVLKQLLTTDKIILTPRVPGNYRFDYKKYILLDQEDLLKGKKNDRWMEIPEPKGTPIYASVQRPIDNGKFSQYPERILTTAPAGQRMGILTHPAWLVAQSDAMNNHAIHRGIWVRERLLGGGIPDVPITVDAVLPDEPENTLRKRMRVTQEAYCLKCHHKVDPIGLTFEMYNHVGMFRTTEKGKPVDTSGEITESGDPTLDGKVKNAFEMIQKLANSERVEQVFVRHAFRFWMGRNETLNDRPVLQAAWKAYHDAGGSMKALLKSLLTSDAFLYRKVDSEATAAH